MIRIMTRAEMMERRKALNHLAFKLMMAEANATQYVPTDEDRAEAQRRGLVWNPEINDFDEPKKEQQS